MEITVLPADDPSKLRLNWCIYESEWCHCIVLDMEPYLYNTRTNQTIKYDEASKIANNFNVSTEAFLNMLHWGMFKDEKIELVLNNLRNNV